MINSNVVNPVVTVIIATYNRPEVLKKCIQSVLQQSYTDWVLYIVGDNCSPTTAEMLNEFSDQRIHYYNNPFRFGEQSGGNSIGAALSNTEYLAYLNHDDLWTPLHLETAVLALQESRKDFYIGRSVISRNSLNGIPEFREVSNRYRKPYWSFLAHPVHFEPCSSWVLRTAFAHHIGPWKQAIQLYRNPLQEYVMRAWFKKGKFYFGEKITCVKLNQHQTTKDTKNQYDYVGTEHDYLLNLFAQSFDVFQSMTEESLLESHPYKRYNDFSKRSLGVRMGYDLCVNRVTAYFYYVTGIDLYGVFCKSIKREKGEVLMQALKNRTGEVGLKAQDIEEVISYARKNYEH